MPAEGVHFSALDDSRVEVPYPRAARLGAVFVDLPYFEAFPLQVLRYVLRKGPSPSRWGDVTHHRAPIAVGRGLMEEGVRLGGDGGAWLRSFALGYISHAAVDRSVHPFVNALAAARAKRFSDSHARQHQEVEKFQSILFHDARMGFEVMGSQALYEHCLVEAGPLWRDGAVSTALMRTLRAVWGETPSASQLRGWAKGYGQYIRLIASVFGRRIAPREVKEKERAELFTGFPERFGAAVTQSRAWMQALAAYGADGRFDDSARTQLDRTMPEGTIDPS